jgi:hypothetical protein
LFEDKKRYHLFHLTKEFYEFIEEFQGRKSVITPLHTMNVNVGGENFHKPTLHTKDFNVQGDKIHKPTPTQETHDENNEFQLQDNINEFQDPIAKHSWYAKSYKFCGLI